MRDGAHVFVAGVRLQNDPDATHFVRAYRRRGHALTSRFRAHANSGCRGPGFSIARAGYTYIGRLSRRRSQPRTMR